MTDDKEWRNASIKEYSTERVGPTQKVCTKYTFDELEELFGPDGLVYELVQRCRGLIAELEAKDAEIAKRRASARKVAHVARAYRESYRRVGARFCEVVDELEELYAENDRLTSENGRLRDD